MSEESSEFDHELKKDYDERQEEREERYGEE